MILRLNDQFYGLLSYFLSYLIDSLVKKPCHVRSGWIGLFPPLLDDLLQAAQKVFVLVLFIPAGVSSRMTYRAQGFRPDQKSIPVAIQRNALHKQIIAALLPLGPQPSFAPAEKSDLPFLLCFIQR